MQATSVFTDEDAQYSRPALAGCHISETQVCMTIHGGSAIT